MTVANEFISVVGQLKIPEPPGTGVRKQVT